MIDKVLSELANGHNVAIENVPLGRGILGRIMSNLKGLKVNHFRMGLHDPDDFAEFERQVTAALDGVTIIEEAEQMRVAEARHLDLVMASNPGARFVLTSYRSLRDSPANIVLPHTALVTF